MKEITIIEKKLEKLNKQQLQKIYKILHNKNTQNSKQNIIKELLQPLYHKYKMELVEYQKPIDKFEYTWNNCWNFTRKPDVDISQVNKEGIYEIDGKKIELHNIEDLGRGGHGKVSLLADRDNEYQFALKQIEKRYTEDDKLKIDEEIPIIKEIENKKISCNVVPVKVISEDNDFWYIIMPKYDKGDLSVTL